MSDVIDASDLFDPRGAAKVAARILRAQEVSCAAWLVFRHRRQLRRSGAVKFFLPAPAPVPVFFSRAIAALGRRGWGVQEVEADGGRAWIVSKKLSPGTGREARDRRARKDREARGRR